MSDLKNIFDSGPEGLSEDKLLAYLEGRLLPEEEREVEALLSEEGMEADAIEGLKNVSAEHTQRIKHQINGELRKQLRPKKHKRKRPITENKWAWVAVAVILLLAILAYAVIHLSARH